MLCLFLPLFLCHRRSSSRPAPVVPARGPCFLLVGVIFPCLAPFLPLLAFVSFVWLSLSLPSLRVLQRRVASVAASAASCFQTPLRRLPSPLLHRFFSSSSNSRCGSLLLFPRPPLCPRLFSVAAARCYYAYRCSWLDSPARRSPSLACLFPCFICPCESRLRFWYGPLWLPLRGFFALPCPWLSAFSCCGDLWPHSAIFHCSFRFRPSSSLHCFLPLLPLGVLASSGWARAGRCLPQVFFWVNCGCLSSLFFMTFVFPHRPAVRVYGIACFSLLVFDVGGV